MGEHKLNPQALVAKMGMLPPKRAPDAPIPVNVSLCHDGHVLVVSYSQRLEFITYTPDQAKAHIENMQGCLNNLLEHQAQAKLNTLTTEGTPAAAANEVST